MKKLLYLLLLSLCACGLQGHETLGIQGTPKVTEETSVVIPEPSSGATLNKAEVTFVQARLASEDLYTKVMCSGNQVYIYILKSNGQMIEQPWCYRPLGTNLKPGIYLLNLQDNSLKPEETQSH